MALAGSAVRWKARSLRHACTPMCRRAPSTGFYSLNIGSCGWLWLRAEGSGGRFPAGVRGSPAPSGAGGTRRGPLGGSWPPCARSLPEILHLIAAAVIRYTSSGFVCPTLLTVFFPEGRNDLSTKRVVPVPCHSRIKYEKV